MTVRKSLTQRRHLTVIQTCDIAAPPHSVITAICPRGAICPCGTLIRYQKKPLMVLPPCPPAPSQMAPKIIFETTSPSDPPPLSLKHPASSPLKRVKGKRVKPSSGDPEDIFSDMAEEQATQEAIFGIVDPQDNATPQMTNRADNGATEPDQIAAAGDKQSLANALPAPRETHPVVPHSIHDSPNHSTVSDPDPPSSTMDTEPHAPAPVSLPDSPHLGSTPHLLPGTPQIAPPPADFDITMKGIPTPPPAPIIAAVPANSDGLMAIPPGGFPPSEQVDFSSLALALYPTRFKQFNERATETDCVTFVLNGRFDLEGEQAAAIEEHIRHITGNPNAEADQPSLI
ncbi:hypothetical protein M422DRAFT_272392 [Sphaerobolus stellatus SS14]|uniref:Uncharacterized protein n=1 Tax=Sphaerobolus stellatus (strain SS14) TaxID=990650 RepID=A0A0C9UM25_SPHS4|nr:hypothetical protein M422DRAFT_272392 [Sphaerobolus stellatus SS14]